MLKKIIKRYLRSRGLEISKFTEDPAQQGLIKYFEQNNIQSVFDVGGNVGQYASRIRRLGYKGNIYSFEPLPDAFAELQKLAANDSKWECFNIALGNANEEVELHQSANSYSSSILELEQKHLDVAPESRVINSIKVPVKKWSEYINQLSIPEGNIFMKIDTQGYEYDVLLGCENRIKDIKGIQLEMSLISMYKGEKLFVDFLSFFANNGFELFQVIPGLTDPQSGRMLQLDGIFIRKSI